MGLGFGYATHHYLSNGYKSASSHATHGPYPVNQGFHVKYFTTVEVIEHKYKNY